MRAIMLVIGCLCWAPAVTAQTTPAPTTPAKLERYAQAAGERAKFEVKYTADIRFKLRLLNHFRYEQAPLAKLVTLDSTFSAGPRSCDMLPDPANALVDLIRAADRFAVGQGSNLRLRAGSCFRSFDEQVAIFCSMRSEARPTCFEPIARALTSAPAGFSEHATGYTLDFFVRRVMGKDEIEPGLCEPDDSEPCKGQIEGSPFGQWLNDNAAQFGFELSFPCANKDQLDPIKNRKICLSSQGVMYEPWHWRWVGKNDSVAGASDARTIFAAARACFAAKPAVGGPVGTCNRPATKP